MELQPSELEFECSLHPDSDSGLDSYLVLFAGRALHWDDDTAELVSVGSIKGVRVDLATARADHLDLNELLDAASQHLSEFNVAVVHGDICELASSTSGDTLTPPCECLVFVESLEVEPTWRGRGVGTFMLRKLGQVIDMEDGLLSLKAYPIVHHQDDIITRSDIERVHHFYRRLGFEPLTGHYMVKDARQCEPLRKRRRGRLTVPQDATRTQATTAKAPGC